MIVTHPDNLKLFPKAAPAPCCGLVGSIPIDGIEIRTDPLLPRTHKTGRLLWPSDPFVTYEDSDREWGLALGFCTEEEAPTCINFSTLEQRYEIDLEFEPIAPPASDNFRASIDRMMAEISAGFSVPSAIVFGGSF
jgi:hypothetical protein